MVKVDLPGGSQVASEEPHASLLSSPSLAASTSTAECVSRWEGQHYSAMLYIHKPTKVICNKLAVCSNHNVTEHIHKPIHTPCAVLLSNPHLALWFPWQRKYTLTDFCAWYNFSGGSPRASKLAGLGSKCKFHPCMISWAPAFLEQGDGIRGVCTQHV